MVVKKSIIVISVIVLLSMIASAANVSVISPYQVYEDRDFSVTVYVEPLNTSISGIQLNLEHNPRSVIINNVSESNFLKQKGANTFYNSGTIRYGIVENIFSAIIGQSNVSLPGNFIIINMTAISGNAYFNLSNVKISDPNGNPVPVNVKNATTVIRAYPKYDLNIDGIVDINDIVYVAQHFGEVIS